MVEGRRSNHQHHKNFDCLTAWYCDFDRTAYALQLQGNRAAATQSWNNSEVIHACFWLSCLHCPNVLPVMPATCDIVRWRLHQDINCRRPKEVQTTTHRQRTSISQSIRLYKTTRAKKKHKWSLNESETLANILFWITDYHQCLTKNVTRWTSSRSMLRPANSAIKMAEIHIVALHWRENETIFSRM